MPEFYGLALLMALLASLFVLLPLMAKPSPLSERRSDTNITVFKERLALLDADYQAGNYDQRQYQLLKTELERSLLDDADIAEPALAVQENKWPLKLLLALLVPLLAFGLYLQTGALGDWRISRTLDSLQQTSDAGQRQQQLTLLAQQLTRQLQQGPDRLEYYMLLGSTEVELKNYPAAVDAYRRLSLLTPGDAEVLAQYAQALYLASGRQLGAEARRVAEQSLALNPHQPTVLGMLGIHSFEQGDYAAAADYWQRLLPGLPPGSPNEKMIRSGIAQARERAGLPAAETPAELAAEEVMATSLRVAVSLAPELTADANASVFVFARAVNGPPMPLAVARLKASELPADVVLDDSMAMTPAMKLSNFQQVEVVARISMRGIANPGSGDLEGSLGPVQLTESRQNLKLSIDRIRP